MVLWQAHGPKAGSAACGAGLEAAAGAQKERDLCGLDGQVIPFWLSFNRGCTCASPVTLPAEEQLSMLLQHLTADSGSPTSSQFQQLQRRSWWWY